MVQITDFYHFDLQLNLWDTLGLEEHAQLTRSHFLLSQAVLMVYSATDQDSLSQAIDLLALAKMNAQGACFILIRNKIDLDATVIEDDAMTSIPPNAFVLQFRTSAVTGEGIQEMLQSVASHLLKKATPMKSIRSHRFRSATAQYTRNGPNDIIELEIEDDGKGRHRKRKCCYR